MIKPSSILTILSLWLAFGAAAQSLRPGYDPVELADMICLNAHLGDSGYVTGDHYIALPEGYKRVFRSAEVGLLNRCDLWINDRNFAVISVRGSTPKAESWLANFYAAMLPASGRLILHGKDTVDYHLSDDPKAAVHAGWLISTAYLTREILPRIDSCYRAGIRDFIITGHSQGGAISYLLTSHLIQLRSSGALPHDLRFKTYCTAAPKPGNLYYAYAFEEATRNGWAFNVVSVLDWVPEVPVSIQTLDDFNSINPFPYARSAIKKQKFPKNLELRYVYNQLYKPPRKAQRNYEKYLGEKLSGFINKALEGIQLPPYYPSNHYTRTGTTHLLVPDSGYYRAFPQTDTNVFVNHMHHPYLYLADRTRLSAIPPAVATNPAFDSLLALQLGADDYGMKGYVLVVLKSGTFKPTEKSVTDSLFAGHMANIIRLEQEGKLVVAGPLGKNEKSYRGIFILDVTAIEEARRLVDTDPAVSSALLEAEYYNWYGSAALPLYLGTADRIWKKGF